MRWLTKLETFRRFAEDLSKLSTCKRAGTGCIIFPFDFSRVYAIGYNGPARGRDNDACTGEEGQCGCAHAEGNTIAKLDGIVQHAVMYTLTSPCVYCTNMIINSGKVDLVIYGKEYRDLRGTGMFAGAGIICIDIKEITDDHVQQWRSARSRHLGVA